MVKFRRKKTYKVKVFRYIFFLTAILILVFGAYTYYNYDKEYKEKAARKVSVSAARIVEQIDERFDNLRQYYVTRADDESIKWFLENDIRYSDYSSYKAVYDDMGSEGIFNDYWKGFALVNFKTGWVLSNKGMFHLYEAYNRDILVSIYEGKTDGIEKNYWYYDDSSNINVDTLDREYRLTVETGGLNYIMRLPSSSYNTYALFIANINLETWKNWIGEWLEGDENIVVLDKDGGLIYATDESLVQECNALWQSQSKEGLFKNNGQEYISAVNTSNILGWNYYVVYNLVEDRETLGVYAVIFAILFIWVVGGVLLVSHLIYSPVDNLMKNVLGDEGKNNEIVGNELEYLEGSFSRLKEDKSSLEDLLNQQRDKLVELFELRLIHGEVGSDELSEYMEQFELKQHKCYETVVIILKLGDDELQSTVNEDAICLKLLQEMPKELVKMAWMSPVYNASAIFAIFADDDEDMLVNKVQLFNEKMSLYVEEMCGYNILMGVSSTHEKYNHIRAAYRESVNALTSGGDGDCSFYLSKVSEHDNNYNGTFEHDIKSAVGNMDKDECYRIIDEFDKFLVDRVSFDMIPLYAARMADSILLSAVNTHIDLEKVYPDGVNKLYRELMQVNEHSRIRRYLKSQFIDPLLIERKKLLEDTSYMVMNQIEKKIAESKGNISVTECAEALGVSTSYIWKVLKMESGKSFSDYQDEYKLEEAKRLLLQTDMSVVEIAAELNYTNAQNFIRFFSKKTGITPGKFRKL
jgi:AraC-like DNA-binding protein